MQIGDPSYKECPHCEEKNEYFLGPFYVHIYEFTEWSDGETFNELPNLKESELQKCRFCNKFYWFKQSFGGLSFDDYCQAIDVYEKLYANQIKSLYLRRLFYIRLQILRTYNDKIRVHPLVEPDNEPKTIPQKDKTNFFNNAIQLIELVKIFEPKNHFLLAELYRNIGSFNEARIELNEVKDEKRKSLLLKEISKRNREVIKIEPIEESEYDIFSL